jgi:hypothetical protein
MQLFQVMDVSNALLANSSTRWECRTGCDVHVTTWCTPPYASQYACGNIVYFGCLGKAHIMSAAECTTLRAHMASRCAPAIVAHEHGVGGAAQVAAALHSFKQLHSTKSSS